MALVATAGAANANSYCDLAFADSFFSSRLGSEKWLQAQTLFREASLVTAAIVLDSDFSWIGVVASDTQSMRWPRKYVEDVDGREVTDTTIPLPIKQAQCELALQILKDGEYTGVISDLDTVRVGSIRVDFDQLAAKYAVPRTVLSLLSHWGTYEGAAGGRSVKVAKLVRT